MRKIAVVGSREGISYSVVADKLEVVFNHYNGAITIVSGGARGVDSHAYRWAGNKGVDVMVFPADWATHGRSAGMRRNANIINEADVVLAFWDGQSPGTRNSIDRARAAGKRLYVFDPSGNRVSG